MRLHDPGVTFVNGGVLATRTGALRERRFSIPDRIMHLLRHGPSRATTEDNGAHCLRAANGYQSSSSLRAVRRL